MPTTQTTRVRLTSQIVRAIAFMCFVIVTPVMFTRVIDRMPSKQKESRVGLLAIWVK